MSTGNTEIQLTESIAVSGVSRAEMAEALSVTSRKASRDSLHADIEAFLARGGVIQQVEVGVSAEPELH